MTESDYANPHVLVDTSWVAAYLEDHSVRLVEVEASGQRYATGHIPGAVALDWRSDLQSQSMRDFVTREEFEALMASRGIANDTIVVFYGDSANLYAACAFWLFKLYGHRDCRILDGGRAQWEAGERQFSSATPDFAPSAYRAQAADLSLRAFRDQVLAHIYANEPLVDARSPAEYAGTPASGRPLHPTSHAHEGAQRAGHIPTARNVPWTATTNPGGGFKRAAELHELYRVEGISPDQPVITYSNTGERSAHTWFVLTQLLGYPDVRNYDGSWTEWGSLVRAPIERGAGE